MNMKQTLIALLLVLTLGTTDVVVAQRHRHTPRTEALSGKPNPDDKAHQTAAGKAKDEGIDAFSDTTSAADAAVMDTTDTTYTSSYDDDVDDFNDASWFIKALSLLSLLSYSFCAIFSGDTTTKCCSPKRLWRADRPYLRKQSPVPRVPIQEKDNGNAASGTSQ